MVNIHGIKQKIIIARRFIRSELKKNEPNKIKIIRTRNGIKNLQEKLRRMREENEAKTGKRTRKKGR